MAFGLLFILPFANAEEKSSIKSEPTLEQKLIDTNIEISNWFDGVAEGLDLFLVGKKLTNKKNESNIVVQNSSFVKETEGFNNISSLNVNLRLPNLEEYWQLKFASYDEENERRNVRSGYLRQTPRTKDYGASIGLFRKLGNVRTSFQPRISFQNRFRLSHLLRFESVADLKTYKINPRLEFYADAVKGPGMFWSLNFNFTVNDIWSLTLLNEANYEDKTHLYSAGNGFSIGQWVSPNATIDYALTFASLNQPSFHLDSYSASISWNQLIYKKILDYQLIPHVDFAKDQGFKGLMGLVFNLNLNF